MIFRSEIHPRIECIGKPAHQYSATVGIRLDQESTNEALHCPVEVPDPLAADVILVCHTKIALVHCIIVRVLTNIVDFQRRTERVDCPPLVHGSVATRLPGVNVAKIILSSRPTIGVSVARPDGEGCFIGRYPQRVVILSVTPR
jgi:hypothetical protein